MIAAGRLFVERSLQEGGKTKWLGCIDHLLQLVTKKTFSDLPISEGTLKACRNLVNFFNSSSQATKKLLGKQVEGRAVKPIQDVTTRWWSTSTMWDLLLRLKIFLSLLENEGDLTCNLTESHMAYCSQLAYSFKTLYDCTEASGRRGLCDYKLGTLHGVQNQETTSASHGKSHFNWIHQGYCSRNDRGV